MQAVIDTISAFFNGLFDILGKIAKFFTDILGDLIIIVWEKLFEFIKWLVHWVSESCSVCMGGISDAGSLVFNMQASINGFPPAVLYCIDRSGIHAGFQIITCGITVWSILKVVKFIRG